MTEEWKPAPGFKGLYEVSDLGNVRRVLAEGSRPLSPRLNGVSGYAQVFLSREGKVHMRYVHLLVIEAFKGKRPGGLFRADHYDSNRANNKVTNLQWITASANTRRALRRISKKDKATWKPGKR